MAHGSQCRCRDIAHHGKPELQCRASRSAPPSVGYLPPERKSVRTTLRGVVTCTPSADRRAPTIVGLSIDMHAPLKLRGGARRDGCGSALCYETEGADPMMRPAHLAPPIAGAERPSIIAAGPSSLAPRSLVITWPRQAEPRASIWHVARTSRHRGSEVSLDRSAHAVAERLKRQQRDVQVLGVALGVWVLVTLALTPYA
jgi:hypothetical protein